MGIEFRQMMESRGMIVSWYAYPNRTLCATLEEMRKLIKLSPDGYSYGINTLLSLVEEAQTYANRMESAMEDWDDVREGHKEKHKLKEQLKQLNKGIKHLEDKKAECCTVCVAPLEEDKCVPDCHCPECVHSVIRYEDDNKDGKE